MTHAPITIRAATDADAAALSHLADASPARRLHGRVLVAEHEQRMIAAIEVASGAVIADQPSASAATIDAVTLLRRHRYLVLRQAGGGAQTRSLFRRQAARLAA